MTMPQAKGLYVLSAISKRCPSASVTAPHLGATAIQGALARAKVAPDAIEEVFMGNVLSAGIGQAPARQAMKYAGIPDKTPAGASAW